LPEQILQISQVVSGLNLRNGRNLEKEIGSMALVNVVYAHTKVPGYAVHKKNSSIIWSQKPIDGCDAYAYSDAFSYCGKLLGLEMLIMNEPAAVLPGQYSENIWKNFDRVLTWVESIADLGGKFHKFTKCSYDIPYDRSYVRTIDLSYKLPLANKKNAICMINGNKFSSIAGELYSKRIEIAKWFYNHSTISFDVYGTPPFDLPNYIGSLSPYIRKFETLARYRYCLCFENIYHPVWSKGSGGDEKLHDCFMCGTVPIYLGCYDIENYVPLNCFIDFREFKNYSELDLFLQNLSDTQYGTYLDHIENWVRQGGLQRYSMHRLYDKLLALSTPELNEAELAAEPWQPGLDGHHRELRFKSITSGYVWSWMDLASVPPRGGHPFLQKQLPEIDLKSRDRLELQLELNPTDAAIHNSLAEIYYGLGNHEKALTHFQRAVQFQPDNAAYHRNLGDFYLVRENDLQKALEHYRRVVAMQSDDLDTLSMAGNISCALGRLKEAQSYFEKILSADSDNADARRKLHDILS